MRIQAQSTAKAQQPVCAAQTDIPLHSSVFSRKRIPTLPQRERTRVTTPSRDTRSSPYRADMLGCTTWQGTRAVVPCICLLIVNESLCPHASTACSVGCGALEDALQASAAGLRSSEDSSAELYALRLVC